MAKASYGSRSRAQVRVLRLAGLVALLGSCTDPTFATVDAASSPRDEREEAGAAERDAGSSSEQEPAVGDSGGESGSDAQVRVDAASDDAAAAASDGGEAMVSNSEAGAAGGLPSWALGLVGTYAKRSVTFSYDDYVPPPTNTQNVEHAIVKIAQQNDKLRVTMQPCEYTVALKGDSGSPVAFKYPDRFPPLTGDLLIADDSTFVSTPMISHLGFDPVRGGGCTNGRRAPYEDQPWLMDSCQCFAGVLPGMQTDCRVTDTDGDNRSGITMLNPGPITGRYTDVSIVFDYAVTISKGELKSGKRVEWSETRTQSQACINASVDLCSVGNNQLCPGGTTMLIRLSEQVTDAGCEALDKGQFPPAGNNWPEPIDCRMK